MDTTRATGDVQLGFGGRPMARRLRDTNVMTILMYDNPYNRGAVVKPRNKACNNTRVKPVECVKTQGGSSLYLNV